MLKSQVYICLASAGGELQNLFVCPQMEKPAGELGVVKLKILHSSFPYAQGTGR